MPQELADRMYALVNLEATVIEYQPNYKQQLIQSSPKKFGPITYGYENSKISINKERLFINVTHPEKYQGRNYEILKDRESELFMEFKPGDRIRLIGESFSFNLPEGIYIEFKTLDTIEKIE